jgi:hypothetical protein
MWADLHIMLPRTQGDKAATRGFDHDDFPGFPNEKFFFA